MSKSPYEKFFELIAKRSALINLSEDKQISLTEITPPIDWRALFRNKNPVEIEIGCGKGRFLLETSRQHPEINYVGVERALKYVLHTKERLLKGNATGFFLSGAMPLTSLIATLEKAPSMRITSTSQIPGPRNGIANVDSLEMKSGSTD